MRSNKSNSNTCPDCGHNWEWHDENGCTLSYCGCKNAKPDMRIPHDGQLTGFIFCGKEVKFDEPISVNKDDEIHIVDKIEASCTIPCSPEDVDRFLDLFEDPEWPNVVNETL